MEVLLAQLAACTRCVQETALPSVPPHQFVGLSAKQQSRSRVTAGKSMARHLPRPAQTVVKASHFAQASFRSGPRARNCHWSICAEQTEHTVVQTTAPCQQIKSWKTRRCRTPNSAANYTGSPQLTVNLTQVLEINRVRAKTTATSGSKGKVCDTSTRQEPTVAIDETDLDCAHSAVTLRRQG